MIGLVTLFRSKRPSGESVLSVRLSTHTQKSPAEDAARRCLSSSQGEMFYQQPALLATWSQMTSLHICGKIMLLV